MSAVHARIAALAAVVGAVMIAASLVALRWPSPRADVAKAPTLCLDMSAENYAPHGGMVWVPAGDYVMGDDVYPEEEPQQHVHVAGFWMERHEVTNAEFAAFVKATGYVTEAERNLTSGAHPELPTVMRKPGAMVFVMPRDVADMSDISQWWHYIPGANWRAPAGPGSFGSPVFCLSGNHRVDDVVHHLDVGVGVRHAAGHDW